MVSSEPEKESVYLSNYARNEIRIYEHSVKERRRDRDMPGNKDGSKETGGTDSPGAAGYATDVAIRGKLSPLSFEDKINDGLHGSQLFRLLIRNIDIELFLQSHYDLRNILFVGPKVINE